MSKKKKEEVVETVEEVVETVEEVVETVEEIKDPEVTPEEALELELPEVESEVEPEEEHGGAVAPAVIAGCGRLNVRKEAKANAEVVCVIAAGHEVQVDLDKSTEEFYKIHTYIKEVSVEGYCMKQFVSIK